MAYNDHILMISLSTAKQLALDHSTFSLRNTACLWQTFCTAHSDV